MEAALNNKGGVFFVYGYGGTGKTFLWRASCACFRSKGDIVVVVASSGIAATLIPGGVTAYSRFGISINVLRLTKNMRLQVGSSTDNVEELRKFSEWLLEIGDGIAGGENDGEVDLELPNLLIRDVTNPIKTLVDVTYPGSASTIVES
ncbi:uncharacterized protein LOC141588050 [Silene latifolia]|uniref:uncharacterized protein LOC141588050 n=1 Tax=Silene latifolia TaxID=37657 RepID=UPI003D76B13F